MVEQQPTFGVLGAGSWGTALAIHLARCHDEVRLWTRSSEHEQQLRAGTNERYLPGVRLPSSVRATSRMEDLAECNSVLVVVPSHGFRQVLRQFLASCPGDDRLHLISGTKGIEVDTVTRMSEVCSQEAERAGRAIDFAVLSGPSFAAELVAGTPTACVVASDREAQAARLRHEFSGLNLRVYSSADVVGVEIAGTAKNVVAIAAGAAAGLGFGHNTLAALMTRGLHEITRLGVACGGQRETFLGLAGMGDLVLTCTGGLSRNRQTGLLLAEGKTLEQILNEINSVAEGVRNSKALAALAAQHGVDMPITEQMVQVLYEGKSPRDAVVELMSRDLKSESEL